MLEQCYFLGWQFPGGNCAEWFSGSASAFAVAVALGGYFYSEWQRRSDRHDRLHDALANASIVLQACLAEATMAFAMATEDPVSIRANGKDYVVPRLNRGVTPIPISDLSAAEYNLIIKSVRPRLGTKISLIIRSTNILVHGFADYSTAIEEIEPLLRKSALLPDDEELTCSESEIGSLFSAAMNSVSMLPGLIDVSRNVLQACEEFNEELDTISGAGVFKVDVTAAQKIFEGGE